jgi:hypothetical protein
MRRLTTFFLFACIATTLVAMLILTGFNFDFADRRFIVGDYTLTRFEDGETYYLDDSTTRGTSGAGVIGGTVRSIGSTDKFIVALRSSMNGPVDDGWMIIDIRRQKVFGPFKSLQQFGNPEVVAATKYSPREAWGRLCRTKWLCRQ